MDAAKKELMEKFFKRAKVVIMIDDSPVLEVGYKKGVFTIEVKNPLLLMGLGLDLKLMSKDKKGSVIRKAIKEMGFGIKLKYGRLEFDV